MNQPSGGGGGGGNQPPKTKSQQRRRRKGGGGGGNNNNAGGGGGSGTAKAKRPDLWRPVPQLADPEPIVPAPDPTALMRSLGDPPLQGQGAVAEHYLAAVVERAAGLATALAVAAGLLHDPDPDD
jgi:hypothetical protein